ncbi:MAG: hypothetical protein Q8943_20565 [Bacteroidota bacterium]|nr:hypothetical protein [Bacteroidota bacterium]
MPCTGYDRGKMDTGGAPGQKIGAEEAMLLRESEATAFVGVRNY